MLKQYLEAGELVRAHGVRGEMILEPWADSAEFLKKIKRFWFDEGVTDAGLLASRVHKGRLLVTLRGVDTVEKADTLRGKRLYLAREDVKLPVGTYFLQDLLGLKAVDATTGREYGTLSEVLPTGANDVYRIVNSDGKEFLFPAVPHMIKRTSPEDGVIELLPIPGIFDDDGEDA